MASLDILQIIARHKDKWTYDKALKCFPLLTREEYDALVAPTPMWADLSDYDKAKHCRRLIANNPGIRLVDIAKTLGSTEQDVRVFCKHFFIDTERKSVVRRTRRFNDPSIGQRTRLTNDVKVRLRLMLDAKTELEEIAEFFNVPKDTVKRWVACISNAEMAI